MAHSPEHPRLYVCADCHVVSAGTVVEHTESGHRYEAPEQCRVCEGTAFVADENWPHHHD
jgi:hypothetical protein